MSELKIRPCPFCGERAEYKEGLATRYVMCLSCEVMGPCLPTGSECIAAWNRRHPAAIIPDPDNEAQQKAVATAIGGVQLCQADARAILTALSKLGAGNAD